MFWLLFVTTYLSIGYGAGWLWARGLADNDHDDKLSFGRSVLRTLMFPLSSDNWQYRFYGDEYRGLRKCISHNCSGIIENEDDLISYRTGILFLWPYLLIPVALGVCLNSLYLTVLFGVGLFRVFKRVINAGDSVFIKARSLILPAPDNSSNANALRPEYDLVDLLKDVDKKIRAQLVSVEAEQLKIGVRIKDVQQLVAECTQLCADAQNIFIRTHNERLIQCSREELENLAADMKKVTARMSELYRQSSELKEWMRCVDLDERACTLLSSHIADVERGAFESAVGALEAADLEDEFSERIALVQSHLEIKVDDPEII